MKDIMNQKPCVILTGGGMKGAYQYGFFKRIYEKQPDFKIDKVYAVSVGALNAVPIITKKMHVLDTHWKNNDFLPFETIVNEWPSVKSKDFYYRNVERARAFMQKGSIFKSLDTDKCHKMLSTLTDKELNTLRSNLVILSFNTSEQKIVFHRCYDAKSTVNAIQSSSLFPGLFHVNSHIIDGATIDLNNIIQAKRKNNVSWLCLDLQGSMKIPCHATNSVHIFSPRLVRNSTLNVASCLLVTRKMLDDLIDNGQTDADIYLDQLSA